MVMHNARERAELDASIFGQNTRRMLSFKVKLICDPVAQAILKTSPLRGVNNYEFGLVEAVEAAAAGWLPSQTTQKNVVESVPRRLPFGAKTVGNRQ